MSCQSHSSKRPEVTITQSPLTESDVPCPISISMPASSSGLHIQQTKGVMSSDKSGTGDEAKQLIHAVDSTVINIQLNEQGEVLSDSITAEMPCEATFTEEIFLGPSESQQKILRDNARLKDKQYDAFRTWSGRLERQLSSVRGKPQESDIEEANISEIIQAESLPPVRYFDALEGVELDTLRASEKLVLPENKEWPFLLRFPLSCFSICLGLGSQAILWKTLATAPSMRFLHVSLTVNLVLWCISVASMVCVSFIYSLKIVFYFEAIKREYYHPVRVNFFFAPWLVCILLTAAVPPSVAKHIHAAVWYVLMTPILVLGLSIYGQWMMGGPRQLSKVANPTSHLSVAGNFAGAYLGASMGLKQGPLFFFAVGLAHYIVLFVTLYQRLPSNQTVPKDLHPVFFLFVAAPSIASIAWAKLQGGFDDVSKILYFIALFLYMSLAIRINLFRGFKFSLAWWAYELPMTAAALATISYANEEKSWVTQSMSLALTAISSFTISSLIVSTILHAFLRKDLFPNDISIAIAGETHKSSKELHVSDKSRELVERPEKLRTDSWRRARVQPDQEEHDEAGVPTEHK